MPFAVFTAQVVFESAVAGAKQAQFVPTALASIGAQSREISSSHHSEVKILGEMMGNTIRTVEPRGAHGASLGLLFPEHEVIDDERAIGPGEKLTQVYGACRRIACIEVTWTLFKLIVLNGRAFR